MTSPDKKTLIGVTLVAIVALLGWRLLKNDNDEEVSEPTVAGATDDREASGDSEPDSPNTSALDALRNTLKQRRGAGAATEPSGRGTIVGVVTDLDSGEHVEAVDVLFRRGDGEETATSDGNGAFSIGLAAGRYQVRAIGDRMISVPQPDVTLLPGDEAMKVNVSVRQLATVAGKVVDYAGATVPGATVHFIAQTPGERALTRGGLLLDQVATESDGRFELDVIPKKALFIEARKGHLRRRVVIEKLVAGERRSDITIALQRGVRVSGTVVGPGGAAVAGARVVLAVDRSTRQEVDTDRGGRFKFEPMAPGSLVLEATARGFAGSAPYRAVFKPGQEIDRRVVLQKAETLAGKVVDSDGKPIENARVRIGRGGSQLKGFEEYTLDDGTFKVTSVDRGKHWVSAVKGGFAIATVEGVKPPVSDLELVLLPFGSIAGKVTSARGAPVSDFVVNIVTVATTGVSRPRPDGRSTRFREESGEYRIDDLEPGRYEIAIRAGARPTVKLALTVPPDGVARGDAIIP